VLLASGIAVVALIVILARSYHCRVEIPRTNPYRPDDVVRLMLRRGLYPERLPKVAGTRFRSVVLRSPHAGGAIVVYVRRELLLDDLPRVSTARLGVESVSSGGAANASVYVAVPPGSRRELIETKAREIAADLARHELIPCTER
jgi:hypothetical protein